MLQESSRSFTIRLALPSDASQICAIYNPYIAHSHITFEEEPVGADTMAERIEAILPALPWLVWEQRQEILPRFETDVKLLEGVLGESFRDWNMPRERSGGMVGGRPAGQSQARNGRRNSPDAARS